LAIGLAQVPEDTHSFW